MIYGGVLMKLGMCGSMESNDCIITIKENCDNKNNILINSIVDDFFHKQIESVILSVLEEKKINGVDIECNDKGALDFTIRARMLTAIDRFNESVK